MKSSLPKDSLAKIMTELKSANDSLNKYYPGENSQRQPIHTVYGGAHLFKADSAEKLGVLAFRSMMDYAPDCFVFARALRLPGHETLPESDKEIVAIEEAMARGKDAFAREFPAAWLAHAVYNRVIDKLTREAVEDFRVDFEDGYGNRPDQEEDEHAVQVASEMAKGMQSGSLPPYIGIRIKPFTEELKARSVRTLDVFLTALVGETGGKLPQNFVVTLPKVTIPEQVEALVEIFELLEKKLSLESGSLKMEIMIETTQSIFNTKGESNILALVLAAKGRCRGAHFGTYDYTASCNITAQYQSMDHPACDFAKDMMKVSLAGTDVWLSDGATNVMPVGPHKAEKDGRGLSKEMLAENTRIVHNAWKLSYDHIRHSLKNAFYQGWDLHPAQLPVRYAACYAFFLEGIDPASLRLKSFMDKLAQATLVGDVFDDAATGQGLLNYFLRALNCGAITEEEVLATGLSVEEVRCRSFAKIVAERRQKSTIKA